MHVRGMMEAKVLTRDINATVSIEEGLCCMSCDHMEGDALLTGGIWGLGGEWYK